MREQQPTRTSRTHEVEKWRRISSHGVFIFKYTMEVCCKCFESFYFSKKHFHFPKVETERTTQRTERVTPFYSNVYLALKQMHSIKYITAYSGAL